MGGRSPDFRHGSSWWQIWRINKGVILDKFSQKMWDSGLYIYEQKMRREVAILQAIVQEMKWRQGAEGKTKFLEEEERQVVEETVGRSKGW